MNDNCSYRRFGETKFSFPDLGARGTANWWELTSEFVGKTMGAKGLNNWNLEDYFTIPFVSSTSSAAGTTPFDGV